MLKQSTISLDAASFRFLTRFGMMGGSKQQLGTLLHPFHVPSFSALIKIRMIKLIKKKRGMPQQPRRGPSFPFPFPNKIMA
jgi:hypothetical protein